MKIYASHSGANPGNIYILLILVFIMAQGFPVYAQESYDKEIKGIVWHGEKGVEQSLQQILLNQDYMEKHHMLQHSRYRKVESNEEEILRQKVNNPNSPAVAFFESPDYNKAPIQRAQSSFNIPISFDAVRHSDITQGWLPPDPMVACGPAQLIVTVNGRLRVFDKNGNMQYDINADVFFQSVRGGSNVVDPRVRYDVTSHRWFISSITNSFSNNRILLAVSSSGVLTLNTTFKIIQFQQNNVGTSPNIDDGLFADYETLGVDANAVYIGANMFYGPSLHTSVFVLRKSDLINGTITATAFRNIGNATAGGPWTPQGVSNSDPAASEGYFIGTDFIQTGLLVIRRIQNPGGTPSISGNLNITVPSTADPLSVPNKNGFSLDALDTRLLLATMNKNYNTGKYSIWCSHSINVNSSGIGTASGDRDAVRWYELGNIKTTPSLVQAGTLFDNAASQPNNYWMGTICMNGNGDALISCSVAGNTIGANGAVAVHYSTSNGGSTSLPQATTSNLSGYSGYRWGDYSSAVVDPTDNLTFWACHEYVMNGDYVIKIAKVTVTGTPAITANSNAINQQPKWIIAVSPNPAKSNLHVMLQGEVSEQLYTSITNLYGIKISENTITPVIKEWNEDISKLQAGIYVINVSTGNGDYKQSLQFEKR